MTQSSFCKNRASCVGSAYLPVTPRS